MFVSGEMTPGIFWSLLLDYWCQNHVFYWGLLPPRALLFLGGLQPPAPTAQCMRGSTSQTLLGWKHTLILVPRSWYQDLGTELRVVFQMLRVVPRLVSFLSSQFHVVFHVVLCGNSARPCHVVVTLDRQHTGKISKIIYSCVFNA